MKEYPVFVPYGNHRLAAVITVPDGEPRGLVLLLPGVGAPRSHRFAIWTRAARRLADQHHLASARIDWVGIGDSTGSIRDWRFNGPAIDEASEVAKFAMKAVGVDRFAAAGNCLGSRASLALAAATPECVGAALVRAPLLRPGWSSHLRKRARRSKVLSRILKRQRVKNLVKRLLGRAGARKVVGRDLSYALTAAIRHSRLLLLYSAEDHTYNERLRTELDLWAGRLPEAERERYEFRLVPEGPLKGFESLRIQEVVIETVVDWLPGCFESGSDAGAGVRPSRAHHEGPGDHGGERAYPDSDQQGGADPSGVAPTAVDRSRGR